MVKSGKESGRLGRDEEGWRDGQGARPSKELVGLIGDTASMWFRVWRYSTDYDENITTPSSATGSYAWRTSVLKHVDAHMFALVW